MFSLRLSGAFPPPGSRGLLQIVQLLDDTPPDISVLSPQGAAVRGGEHRAQDDSDAAQVANREAGRGEQQVQAPLRPGPGAIRTERQCGQPGPLVSEILVKLP